MEKIFSVNWWMLLISCCCIGTGITLACVDGWEEEYGVSNFSPEIFVDSAYSPFFYSLQFYYRIGHDEQQHTRFNNSNISEWAAFLKNGLTHTELQYLLEQATTAAIDSAAGYLTGKIPILPPSLESFNTLKQKNNKNLAAFLSYLQLAKKSESFALNDIPYAWNIDEKTKTKTPVNAVGLNHDLLAAFSKATDPFLKERYWFQLVRSYFFTGSLQQAIDLFNNTEKSIPANILYYRTMAYTAGAYYKLKNYSKANYYYSRVYEGCNELKTVAHYSFHPQEEKDWSATLALCKNNGEKVTLWQMLGIFYHDEQRSIREIYQLEPASDKLDVLLARSVNKYEQRFNPGNDSFTEMPVDSAAMATLPMLITKIATAANTGKPWIWQMAAGYLKTLDEKYAEAAIWFAAAEKKLPVSKTAQAQLRLLKMINTIAQAKRIDQKLESQVMNDIEWLRTFDPKELPELRYADAFTWLKQKMAAKYRQQKDWVKAECFFSKTSFYSSNGNIENMKAFLDKPGKTPYEKLCAALSVKKTEDLFEFQAISLAYADSIDAAIGKMEKAAGGAATMLLGNPFNGRIQDCHDCDHEAPQKIRYTKLFFLKKVQDIKSKITAGDDIYTNAVLLANAHYNISHFGNARIFYECKILGESHSNPDMIDSAFRKMVTGTGMAAKYYTLALQHAATDEQKAKCQYMLAKCERNHWYNENLYNKTNGYAEDLLVNFNALNGFKALKQYANTQYYKDVIKECGYFRIYIGSQK